MILRLLQETWPQADRCWAAVPTRIGDPSGKDESRQMLTDETVHHARQPDIRRCFGPYLRFGDGPTDAIMANNAPGRQPGLGYIPCCATSAPFTINRMLSFDS